VLLLILKLKMMVVSLLERDSMVQERIKIEDVERYLFDRI